MRSELIATARKILSAASRKPSQADLRRAVSTAYYALFDCLARMCADEIVGSSPAKRASEEWIRVYRALNHGKSENALDELDPTRRRRAKLGQASSLDPAVEAFCETLERLRVWRNNVDYNLAPLKLKKIDVRLLVDEAELAVDTLFKSQNDYRRKLAFACIVSRRA